MRDLKNKTRRYSLHNLHLEEKDKKFVRDDIFPQELPSNTCAVSISPSGKRQAVFLTNTDESYQVQIYEKSFLLCSIRTEKKHGKIFTEETFSVFCWHKKEEMLLYVAEEKREEEKEFLDDIAKEEHVGGFYEFQDNWGDSLSFSIRPSPFVLDICNREVKKIEIDSSLSVAQPQFCNQVGLDFVFVGYDNTSRSLGRKLGMKYCKNRASRLYLWREHSKTIESISGYQDLSVRSPRVSPDGKICVYLSSMSLLPHQSCSSLRSVSLDSHKVETLIEPVEFAHPSQSFCGIFTDNLPASCWLTNQVLVFTTQSRAFMVSFLFDLHSKKLSQLKGFEACIPNTCSIGSLVVNSANDGFLVANLSSPSFLQKLCFGKYQVSSQSVHWFECQPFATCPPHIESLVSSFEWKVIDLSANQEKPEDSFQIIFTRPKEIKQKLPTVLLIHGGPHSAFSVTYSHLFSFFNSFGYACAVINYRGSYGYSQKGIEGLMGKIGEDDVSDILFSVDTLLNHKETCNSIDNEQLFLFGGSHGGFLTAHVIGRTHLFKAAAVRNPVINIASMIDVTDIPDWCLVEGIGGNDRQENVLKTHQKTSEEGLERLSRLYKCSPIFHVDNVKTPCAIFLGMEDLRVPPSQGKSFYFALRQRGVATSLYCYPNENHALEKVEFEADHLLNTLLWFEKHK